MNWSDADIIAALSSYVELAPGDLIFTGTPAGVGPIERGETLRGMIAGLEPIEITFEVGPPHAHAPRSPSAALFSPRHLAGRGLWASHRPCFVSAAADRRP